PQLRGKRPSVCTGPQIMLVGCRARAMLHRKRPATPHRGSSRLPRAPTTPAGAIPARLYVPLLRAAAGTLQAARWAAHAIAGGLWSPSAAALRRLPLMRTLSVAACYARDGYLLATAEAVLLEAYGGLPERWRHK
ncbi:unnamed protein product, partial [Effrenium voratum]